MSKIAHIEVLCGDRPIGHLISRGRDGYQAYAGGESLGLFGTRQMAAEAVTQAYMAEVEGDWLDDE
jgi:hypothetical protein